MLGKLFEETVNERHSSGAYYTPRPVVSFMCRAALKGYLAGRNIPGLADDGIADLPDNRNPDAVTQTQAPDIANAVSELKAVDPAGGSGAFLLGMMQEILARNDSLFRAGHTPESLYRQKLNIITDNIYGADRDTLAVSTAMLRLWLSLAVDYDGAGPPDPLPNLDFKLVAGDALAGPDPQQPDFTLQSIFNNGLQHDIAAYTVAHGPQKEALKRRVDFAAVMLAGGFDIVIANPPYVRQEEIAPPEYKQFLLKAYPDAAVGRSDLYCYFYARGLQLLKEGGVHLFVCSNSWLDVGYGARLQQYLLDNATLDAIYESAVERQFATADVNTIITIITIISVIRKRAGVRNGEGNGNGGGNGDDADAGRRREIVKTGAELRAAATSGRRFVGDKWGGKYRRAPDIYHQIRDKCGDKLVRLGDIAAVRGGVTTGANDFFANSVGERCTQCTRKRGSWRETASVRPGG